MSQGFDSIQPGDVVEGPKFAVTRETARIIAEIGFRFRTRGGIHLCELVFGTHDFHAFSAAASGAPPGRVSWPQGNRNTSAIPL